MLGTSYNLDHKHEQAESVLKRALQVYAMISPPHLLGAERTEDNLGAIYLEREDYASAERHFFEALSLSEKIPAGPVSDRGNILLNLGFIRMVQGRYPEAEQLLDQSVEALASDPGPWAQRDLANAFYRLGGVYTYENRYPEAEQQYRKALESQEKLSGLEQPGSRSRAPRFRRALPGRRKICGIRIALQTAQAEASIQRALTIREKKLPANHPWIATILNNLASVYLAEGEFEKAAPLIKRAQGIR